MPRVTLRESLDKQAGREGESMEERAERLHTYLFDSGPDAGGAGMPEIDEAVEATVLVGPAATKRVSEEEGPN